MKERQKAESIFLDDVENDIDNKERFINQQINILQDMVENKNTLIEHKNVLLVVQQVIQGAVVHDNQGRLSHVKLDEEKKVEEIQMEQIEGGGAHNDYSP